MLHRSLRFLFAFASNASRTRKSSFPASESAWISMSHLSQSFSDSHRTSSVNSSLGSLSISVLSSSTFDMVYPPDNISDADLADPGAAGVNHSYPYSVCHPNPFRAIRPDGQSQRNVNQSFLSDRLKWSPSSNDQTVLHLLAEDTAQVLRTSQFARFE
jgi:hypothetical protein